MATVALSTETSGRAQYAETRLFLNSDIAVSIKGPLGLSYNHILYRYGDGGSSERGAPRRYTRRALYDSSPGIE